MIYQKIPMQPNHMVLSNLRAAWTAASRKNQHLEGNRALAIHEADMNAPLDTGSRNALQTSWRCQPIIELPATWQAPEGCIGAYYRALERRTITAEPVKGLGNVESASAFQDKPNTWDFGQMQMVAKDGSRKKPDPWKAEFKTDAPWTYIQGLKLNLFALAKAGATAVRPARIDSPNWPARLNGLQDSPNVHLQDMVDYLAKLENFVLNYSRRKSPQQVWLALRNLDETTRKTACEMYRTNMPMGISFSQCMEFAKPWLNLQIQNLELDGKGRGDGTPNRPGAKADRDRDRSRSKSRGRPRGRGGRGKDRGKGRDNDRSRSRGKDRAKGRDNDRPGSHPDPKEPKFKEVKAKYGDSQIWVGTTKRVSGKNLEICKDFNLKGQCPRGSSCKWENCCDVIPKGKKAVCGSKAHTRQEHRDGVWYA